jgi:hypothetical protein
MAVNNESSQSRPGETFSEQEKIQEFIRELALAFRRITGRKVENDADDLPVDLGNSDENSQDDSEQMPIGQSNRKEER